MSLTRRSTTPLKRLSIAARVSLQNGPCAVHFGYRSSAGYEDRPMIRSWQMPTGPK
jgi:hypothetical protein